MSLQSVDVMSFSLFLIVLGLLVGSFLNVVVYRLPIMMMRDWRKQACELLDTPELTHDHGTFNLAVPHSSCPHCNHKIKPWENIPVLSWLFLRGKCSSCKQPISARYPLVELACGVLTGLVVWHYGVSVQAIAVIVLTWGLLAMSLIDADHQLLPDALVLPLLWLGLITNYFGLFVSLDDALWGAVCGYMSLWLLYWAFKLLTGKEGMGHGDFKLLALAGAWGGWQILPLTILLSSVIAVVVTVMVLRTQSNKNGDTQIPYGPYLAGAAWIALLWGDAITARYLSMVANF